MVERERLAEAKSGDRDLSKGQSREAEKERLAGAKKQRESDTGPSPEQRSGDKERGIDRSC